MEAAANRSATTGAPSDRNDLAAMVLEGGDAEVGEPGAAVVAGVRQLVLGPAQGRLRLGTVAP